MEEPKRSVSSCRLLKNGAEFRAVQEKFSTHPCEMELPKGKD